jgi:hypothetical protein
MILSLAALLLAGQEVPIASGRQGTLDQMSSDISAEIASCGTKAVFIMPKGKKSLDDAKAVIDMGATPEQISCAKKSVSWLVSDEEARAKGFK